MRSHLEDGGSAAAADPAVVDRPAAVPQPLDRVREWIDWFGVTRLVTSAIAVVVVCAGAWWLVRTPTPPPESALPTAAADSLLPIVTLPPPAATAATGATEPVDATEPVAVVVHVAGAVAVPGVHRLDGDARVADAIDAAGGATADADVGSVNLAAVLVDGSRIYLPEFGEEVPIPVAPPAGSAAMEDEPPGPVDVNTADARALEQLPGVGPATAAAIVGERDRNGPFVSFGDLERVPGIGPAKLAALEGLVVT